MSTTPKSQNSTARFLVNPIARNMPSLVDVEDAVDHLRRTEKGQKALKALGVFLEETLGLDSTNQKACLTLLNGGWGSLTGTTRELISEAA